MSKNNRVNVKTAGEIQTIRNAVMKVRKMHYEIAERLAIMQEELDTINRILGPGRVSAADRML